MARVGALTQLMSLLLNIRQVLLTETPHCEGYLFCVAQVLLLVVCGFIIVSTVCVASRLCSSVPT